MRGSGTWTWCVHQTQRQKGKPRGICQKTALLAWANVPTSKTGAALKKFSLGNTSVYQKNPENIVIHTVKSYEQPSPQRAKPEAHLSSLLWMITTLAGCHHSFPSKAALPRSSLGAPTVVPALKQTLHLTTLQVRLSAFASQLRRAAHSSFRNRVAMALGQRRAEECHALGCCLWFRYFPHLQLSLSCLRRVGAEPLHLTGSQDFTKNFA